MSGKLLNGLSDLGYRGPLLSKEQLDLALQEGTKNLEFTKLVCILTDELRILLKIDEQVNETLSPEDAITFVMEISSFLKELNCPYSSLTQGHISERLLNEQDRLLLLDYLVTQLMAARILQEKNPDKKIEFKLRETEEAANMRKILMTLRFPKPPANLTIAQLFEKLNPTIKSAVDKAGKHQIGEAAFSGFLSEKQWEALNQVQKELGNEYKIRREMLLTRLDVTIQSFQWSDKTKNKEDLFEKTYSEKRKSLRVNPDVNFADLLEARTDIALIEKTSGSEVRKNTRSALNKVIIGQVPDRGGRTSELAPPPPEMPSWQQRSSGGNRGGGTGFSIKTNYSRGGQQNQGGYQNQRGHQSQGGYQAQGHDSGNSSFSSSRRNSYERPSSSQSTDNRSFDSAGSYGKDYYDQNASKRAKTYDSYQSVERTSYGDQYVQDGQRNQQYQGRGGGRGQGRGRSSYRGGARDNY